MFLKWLALDSVHFFVRRAGWPDAAEEVGQGVEWSKTERQLGLLDEGTELPGVAEQAPVGHLKAEDHEAGGRAVEPAADDLRDHFRQGTLDGVSVYEAGQVEG